MRTVPGLRRAERDEPTRTLVCRRGPRLHPSPPRAPARVARDRRSVDGGASAVGAGRWRRHPGGWYRSGSGRGCHQDAGAGGRRRNAVIQHERLRDTTADVHATADTICDPEPDALADPEPDPNSAANAGSGSGANTRPARSGPDVHGSAGRHAGGHRPAIRDDDPGASTGQRHRGPEPDRDRPGLGHPVAAGLRTAAVRSDRTSSPRARRSGAARDRNAGMARHPAGAP